MPRRLALLMLLAGFAAVVTFYRIPWGSYGNDGSYYVHIARHVAQGDGFVTRVSLQNQGLRVLPAPGSVYPVWPHVLALGGRAIGFAAAAALLAAALALVALVLLYALANVVARCFGERAEVLATVGGVEITTGHVVVALVALNRGFIVAVLQPLTEPLGLALVCASLLALGRALRGPSPVAWAATSATLAAAAYLTRFQLAPIALVVPLALLLAGGRGGTRRAAGVASLIAVALVLAPWIAHLASLPGGMRPMMLFDFAAYRETPELPPGATALGEMGLPALLRGARSVVQAFLPGGRARRSYVFGFGPLALAVPLAALAAVVLRATRRGSLPSGEAAVLPLATAAAGVGMLVPLHLSLTFEARHRLPFVLLLVVALPLLNGALQRCAGAPAARWPATALRVLLLALVVASVASGARRLHRDHERLLALVPAAGASERAAAAWLDARSAVVAMVIPQRLAVVTKRTGFRWIRCRSSREDVLSLLEHVAIDYVVVRGNHRRCAWTGVLPEGATPSASFGSGSDTLTVFAAAQVRDYLVEAIARREPLPDRRERRRTLKRARDPAAALTPPATLGPTPALPPRGAGAAAAACSGSA